MKYFLVALMPALIPIVLSLVFILVLRAVCIRVQRPRKQRGDTYTPLSPTLQWMNTAGSILRRLTKTISVTWQVFIIQEMKINRNLLIP